MDAIRIATWGCSGLVTALPANLCPGSAWAEALCLGYDFCESVGEPVEAGALGAALQRSAKHLHHMLSSEQRIDDAVEASPEWG